MNVFFIKRVLKFFFYYCFKANSSSFVLFITKGFAPIPVNLKRKEHNTEGEVPCWHPLPCPQHASQSSPQLLYKSPLG